MSKYKTSPAGFEPARPKDNALAGHRVNHSAKATHMTIMCVVNKSRFNQFLVRDTIRWIPLVVWSGGTRVILPGFLGNLAPNTLIPKPPNIIPFLKIKIPIYIVTSETPVTH
ncbi:hypothetical protein PHYBLDRAFT_150177 [Phycomyces blakesleeanus NRRL 1555(-)]|uniref:Uncharacterized protein n=1 Tax=Phycomyces blakesleeanus (strain ATCC 8743b / DSM 1359 / FGSC 10004 / NBRC 33097 / NRRL 1555) TaxID=763407 RepID=A0A162THB7_PHYB8|nr:hypothetical protein PHYBLDRAFT_150177 [Phycomyces blakesleeanus NRRL 1555(-)]OAD68582.1 hypothetical protein PHYBLDRAFT_150177 [Phycomyces blakesleeanus NRRL 1555(-)]|eukprot:XP_018286622.1 hypothetical protein PHYBLDRAFT_150177 [Phycomyces blakesleeanus NRRL 1555(-)]